MTRQSIETKTARRKVRHFALPPSPSVSMALFCLLAFTVFVGGFGRLLSMSKVGLPEPGTVWLGYLATELMLPSIIIAAQVVEVVN